jgi:hypothetical protein
MMKNVSDATPVYRYVPNFFSKRIILNNPVSRYSPWQSPIVFD